MLLPKAVCKLRDIATSEPTRYAIDGVLLERDADGKARAVATDGRRLIVVEYRCDIVVETVAPAQLGSERSAA